MGYIKAENSHKEEKKKSGEGLKYALTFLAVFCGVWIMNSLLSGHKVTDFEWIKLFMRIVIAWVFTNFIFRLILPNR